ncbi:hypothetical protein LAZ67_21001740, partial [Cordylochernes scorpioides]
MNPARTNNIGRPHPAPHPGASPTAHQQPTRSTPKTRASPPKLASKRPALQSSAPDTSAALPARAPSDAVAPPSEPMELEAEILAPPTSNSALQAMEPIRAPEAYAAPRPPASQPAGAVPQPQPASVAPPGPLPAQGTLVPPSPSSSGRKTRDDLEAFLKRNPGVSFAGTDGLGLGREEVLDLLSSKTKVQRHRPLLTSPQSDALAGLINQLIDLRPGGNSNLYKILRQVNSELKTIPAAVPPTPPLPAHQPAEPTPPTPHRDELTPAIVTPPPPAHIDDHLFTKSTNLVWADSPFKAEQMPGRHGQKAHPCAEKPANFDLQRKCSINLRTIENFVNSPAGGKDANSATSSDFAIDTPFYGAIKAQRSWANSSKDVNPASEDGFTIVQGKKRRRGSADSPAAAAHSSNARRSGTNRRQRSSAERVPRAQEIKTTRTHIVEARARQASSTEEQCLYVEHCPELEPYHYLKAIDEMVGGTSDVVQIAKVNGHLLLGLSNKTLAERLINEGLEVEGMSLKTFPFYRRAARITIGNLPFFVKDASVIDALLPYGRVTSIVPKQLKAGKYVYTDGRREAFIVPHDGINIESLPSRLDIRIKGEAWPMYLTSGIRCSRCRGQGHRRANCPLLTGQYTGPRRASPSSTTNVPQVTEPELPRQASAASSAPPPPDPAMEVSGVLPAATAASHQPVVPGQPPPAPTALPMDVSTPAPAPPAPSREKPSNGPTAHTAPQPVETTPPTPHREESTPDFVTPKLPAPPPLTQEEEEREELECVLAFIQDADIAKALEPYGQTISIRPLPFPTDNPFLKHLSSLRRKVVFKKKDSTDMPALITINYMNRSFRIYVGEDVICADCRRQGHKKDKCPFNKNIRDTVTQLVTVHMLEGTSTTVPTPPEEEKVMNIPPETKSTSRKRILAELTDVPSPPYALNDLGKRPKSNPPTEVLSKNVKPMQEGELKEAQEPTSEDILQDLRRCPEYPTPLPESFELEPNAEKQPAHETRDPPARKRPLATSESESNGQKIEGQDKRSKMNEPVDQPRDSVSQKENLMQELQKEDEILNIEHFMAELPEAEKPLNEEIAEDDGTLASQSDWSMTSSQHERELIECQGHRRANCPLLHGQSTTSRRASSPSSTNPPPSSAPGLPRRSSAAPPAPAPPSPAVEVSGAPPIARTALLPTAAPRPSTPALSVQAAAPPSVTPAPEDPAGPRSAVSRHPEPPPPARPDLVAPRGPLPTKETLGPATTTQDIEMAAVEETIPSSTSSIKKTTRDDLVAFIKRSPGVSFAGTDALGLGREEVLDLLSSKTKAQKHGPLLTPPQSDALDGLIDQLLDMRPGGSSNLYKILRQVKAEIKTIPAAVTLTPPLPAPQPAEPTPPAPQEKESIPAMATPPPPPSAHMEDDPVPDRWTFCSIVMATARLDVASSPSVSSLAEKTINHSLISKIINANSPTSSNKENKSTNMQIQRRQFSKEEKMKIDERRKSTYEKRSNSIKSTIKFTAIQEKSAEEHLTSIAKLVGHENIHSVGKLDGQAVFSLATNDHATQLINNGFKVGDTTIYPTPLFTVERKYILSGVMAFIQDEDIIKALEPYGKTVSIRLLPFPTDNPLFKHLSSLRREIVFKIKENRVMPATILINYMENFFRVFIGDDVICAGCRRHGHIMKQCPFNPAIAAKVSRTFSEALNQTVPPPILKAIPQPDLASTTEPGPTQEPKDFQTTKKGHSKPHRTRIKVRMRNVKAEKGQSHPLRARKQTPKLTVPRQRI